MFPSLFRDSSDHHAVALFVLAGAIFLFPSLFRDSSDHHLGRRSGRGAGAAGFPSLFRDSSDHHTAEITVILNTDKLFPSLFRDSSDHHVNALIMLVLWIMLVFPSLFRDSSDHHFPHSLPDLPRWEGFHPSLGIPLIITLITPISTGR
jgi:hypothetical protein